MKKILAMVAAMAMFSAAVFADVACKKLDNGKVEVTFSYSHPSAKNVLLAGDFTNWQSGAKTMKKEGDTFVYRKVVSAKSVLTYKFIINGNWMTDKNAPATTDDGFGGKNGVVDVKTLIN